MLLRLVAEAQGAACYPCCAGAIALLWLLVPIQYNLGTALQYSSNFLDAQRATSPLLPLPEATAAAYPWLPRAGSQTEDAVPGGFYMTGTTYVKHTFPQAHTMALLAWGLLTYGDSAAVSLVPQCAWC
jgi:hypothetical protein